MQETSTPSDILVVAAPSEARGAALADALRQAGRNVTLATTPDSAAQAARYAGTIVTLTPATRDDPTVQAAINARPSRMVGFFPEPMILPFGTWSNDPVLLRDSLADAATRLIKALEAPPKADVAAEALAARAQIEAQDKQRQRIRLGIGGAVGVVLVILVIIGLRGINTNTSTNASTTAADTPTPAPTTVTFQSYGAAALGGKPGCDTGTATWQTIPAALQVTCSKGHGTLLATTQATTARQSLSFVPPEGAFPAAYSATVKATFVSGDANVSAFVGVLGQTGHQSQQLCAVNMAGMWQGGAVNAAGTYTMKPGSGGTVTITGASVTVGARVNHHGIVTCLVNGKAVGKAVTSTLTSTHVIYVGMFDPNSTGPFSVQFTTFRYTPVNG